MYEIVSSATADYYPGIIALWNSIKINSPKCSLSVFCYDKTEEYKKLEDMGIKVFLNAPMPGPILDESRFRTSTGTQVGPDMYARLLIPLYFDCERVFYVDADCLVLKEIYELWDDLDLEGHYSACVYRPDVGWIGGNGHDDMASGTFLADVKLWKEKKITETCFQVMKDKKEGKYIGKSFGMNVESVLSFVHNGNYKKLERTYQNLTYYGLLSQEDKVVHFAAVKPWKGSCNYRQLWAAYLHEDLTTIKRIESELPPEKSDMVLNNAVRARRRVNQNKWS